MSNSLTFSYEEIHELAMSFPTMVSARQVLMRAGFPLGQMPASPDTAEGLWEQVAESVHQGVLADGRMKILTEALARRPGNAVFLGAGTKAQSGRTRILVVAASPNGLDQIRGDRELRTISAAVLDRFDLESCPAASVLDLGRVRHFRPDLLHLICHGVGEDLIFEDVDGEVHPVPAVQVVETVKLARMHKGGRLRGVLLRSCDSEGIAELFTDVAETVVAHRGPLHDGCAVFFAGRLYAELVTGADLADAARSAAQETHNLEQNCHSIPEGLVVCHPAEKRPDRS